MIVIIVHTIVHNMIVLVLVHTHDMINDSTAVHTLIPITVYATWCMLELTTGYSVHVMLCILLCLQSCHTICDVSYTPSHNTHKDTHTIEDTKL